MDAIRMARDAQPDVLLLDVAMPRMGGVEALASLTGGGSGPRVILLTAAIQPSDLLKAIQFGARGVVMKESATRLLIDGIHRVMDGKYIIGTDVADDLAQAVKQVGSERARPYKLTARELEIVAAIADGQSNRQIAERLSISLQTVKHHLTSIFDKTGASNRLELALLAIRQGVVDAD
jgi:DNA-binding NarL/FixJ family response regulator